MFHNIVIFKILCPPITKKEHKIFELKGFYTMKKIKKVTSVILGVIISCMCLVTPVSAVENSEAATTNAVVTADIPTPCTHCTMEFHEHNHNTLELIELININSTTACTHSGEKVAKFSGLCECGGILNAIYCKNCGAFIRGMCQNFCGRWG